MVPFHGIEVANSQGNIIFSSPIVIRPGCSSHTWPVGTKGATSSCTTICGICKRQRLLSVGSYCKLSVVEVYAAAVISADTKIRVWDYASVISALEVALETYVAIC